MSTAMWETSIEYDASYYFLFFILFFFSISSLLILLTELLVHNSIC